MRRVCLEQFAYGADAWGLQRNRTFHSYCWGNAVRTHVKHQRRDAPTEPLCAVCRGPGPVVAACKYAGHHGAEDLPNSYAAVEAMRALRGEFAASTRWHDGWSSM